MGEVGALPGSLPGDDATAPTPPASVEGRSPSTDPSDSEPTTTAPRVNDGATSVGRLVEGNRLLVIGDSILASLSDRYSNQLCTTLVPRGWAVVVEAEVGRSVEFGRRVLERQPPEEFDAVVLMLGNNYDGDPQAFDTELGALLDALEPLPVVALNMSRFDPSMDEVNYVLTGQVNERDDVVLLDWNARTADGTPGADTLLAPDGLHLSDDGQVAMAQMISRMLGAAPRGSTGACLGSEFRDDSAGTVP